MGTEIQCLDWFEIIWLLLEVSWHSSMGTVSSFNLLSWHPSIFVRISGVHANRAWLSSLEEFQDVASTILASTKDRVLICGDLNAPGHDDCFINPGLQDVIETLGLKQHWSFWHGMVRITCWISSSQISPSMFVMSVLSTSGSLTDPCLSGHHRVGPYEKLWIIRSCFRFDRLKISTLPSSNPDFVIPLYIRHQPPMPSHLPSRSRMLWLQHWTRLLPYVGRTRSRRSPKAVTRWLSDEAVEVKHRKQERQWKALKIGSRSICYRSPSLSSVDEPTN